MTRHDDEIERIIKYNDEHDDILQVKMDLSREERKERFRYWNDPHVDINYEAKNGGKQAY